MHQLCKFFCKKLPYRAINQNLGNIAECSRSINDMLNIAMLQVKIFVSFLPWLATPQKWCWKGVLRKYEVKTSMTKSCHRLRVLASSRRLRCDTREGVAEDHTRVADHLARLSSSIRIKWRFSIFIHDIIQFWIDWILTFQTKLKAVIYILEFTLDTLHYW